MTTRDSDPYGAHRFHVSCDALPPIGFTEVSGLTVRTTDSNAQPAARESSRSSFRNWPVRAIREVIPPRRETESPPLVLRRGVTDDQALWTWFQRWADGRIGPQDLRVCLLDSEGRPVRGWVCRDATPVRWSGPDLAAREATVAMETLEVTHEGIDAVVDLEKCLPDDADEDS